LKTTSLESKVLIGNSQHSIINAKQYDGPANAICSRGDSWRTTDWSATELTTSKLSWRAYPPYPLIDLYPWASRLSDFLAPAFLFELCNFDDTTMEER